jgi:PAS domain S-box-containing protein
MSRIAKMEQSVGTADSRCFGFVPAGIDWLWACDIDGSVDFLSPEFTAATGCSPDRLLGRHVSVVATAGAGPVSQKRPQAAIAAREPFRDLVYKLDDKDGEASWIEIAGTPIFVGGSFRGYHGTGKSAAARVEDAFLLQRYQQLLEVSSDWFWETNASSRLTYVSAEIEAVLGLPAADYIGKRLTEVEGVIIDPEAALPTQAAIAARQPYRDFIYARKAANGEMIWINISGSPHFGEDGSFRGYRGIARDVTAQVEAKQKLGQSEQNFRQVLEAAADYYFEQDEQYCYTHLSPGYERRFGIPVVESIGKRLSDMPGIAIDPEMGKMALRARKAKQPYRDFVFSRSMPDGRKLWFKSSGAPIVDRNGVFQGYRGVGAEITQQVEADAAARLALQRLHEAVAHLPQPIAVYDNEDRVVGFNQAFTNLHHVPNANTPVCQGATFRDVAEWQLGQGFYTEGAIDLDTLLARYQTEAEFTYHLSDGRWMLVVYHHLPGGGRLGLWTDITLIKRAEAERHALEGQLHHVQRLESLGTLAGGAAHEINNALVPVIALTKLVARKLPEDSRERRNLDTVTAAAERSRDLVKQILAFSRKDVVAHQPGERLDLTAVLSEALSLLRAMLPTSIRIDEAIQPTPAIIGDPSQLQQVIVNIVTNASHAIGGAQGTITVSLQRAEGELCLSVRDTGCGMDEATIAQIFDPFFTTKPVGEGTGLGLSVVHGIVAAHGGRIEVHSKLGQGSQFDILLPVSASISDI